MKDKSISNTYQIKILDSLLPLNEFDKLIAWFNKNSVDYYSKYEPDGDHDGSWIFSFRREEDKVRFILQCL